MQFGIKAKDRITGFVGVVTGRAEYISGCSQILLAPQQKPDGSDGGESRWIDVQRLEEVEGFERIVLDNGPTPGADRPAPIR